MSKSKTKTSVKRFRARSVPTTLNVELTSQEVSFLRDLMSVMLPIELSVVSTVLADKTDRKDAENSLWEKVCNLCEEMSIPVGDNVKTNITELFEGENKNGISKS
jgi:sensor domain CHASE-containing protein